VKNVQNQGLQCVSRYKTMVSSKNTTLIKTPCLYQYDTPLEQMVLIDQVVNLTKCRVITSKCRQKSEVALILEPMRDKHSHKVNTAHLIDSYTERTDSSRSFAYSIHIQLICTREHTCSRKQSVHNPPTWLYEISTTMLSTRHLISFTCAWFTKYMRTLQYGWRTQDSIIYK
jgi:hypothetical protein